MMSQHHHFLDTPGINVTNMSGDYSMDLSIMKKISSHWSKTTYNIPINQNTPQVFLLLLIGIAFVVIQIILIQIHAQLEV